MDALKFLSKASMPSILSAGVVLLPAPHAAAHGTRRSFAIPRAFLANHEFRIPRAVPFLRPLSALAPLITTTHFRAFRGICQPGSSFVTRVTFSLTQTQFRHRQRHVSRKIPVKLRHAHPLHRGPLFASHHGARAVQGPGVPSTGHAGPLLSRAPFWPIMNSGFLVQYPFCAHSAHSRHSSRQLTSVPSEESASRAVVS